MKHYYIIFSIILFITIFLLFYNTTITETLINPNQTWSDDLIRRFIEYQTTVNNNFHQFNIAVLQKQATPKEAEYLLKHGHWPWPNYLKYEFLDYISNNPIIRIEHEVALNDAMKVYNKTAMTQLLAWKTKEGQFLLYGGDLGITEELKPYSKHNTIKCSYNDTPSMIKTTFTGVNLWNGFMDSTTQKIKNKDIPKYMPGFSFINKPCNPCAVFNDPPNYKCPFKLNVGDNKVSPIWKKIWKL